jgi:hypothetical protein
MRQNSKRWAAVLAVVLFAAGSALSIYRLLHRTDQELEAMVFDVEIKLDEYPMPFSDPSGVRCPAALSDGEAGEVHMSVTNEDSTLHTLSALYGDCHVNLDPGETADIDCTVRANNVPDDFMMVEILPIDSAYTFYSPRTPACVIPVVNVGGLSGPAGLIALFLPGVLGMVIGAALWVYGGYAANHDLRGLTFSGLGLLVGVVVAVLVIALLTTVRLRGYLLIVLTAAAVLDVFLLVVQLLVLGIVRWRGSED